MTHAPRNSILPALDASNDARLDALLAAAQGIAERALEFAREAQSYARQRQPSPSTLPALSSPSADTAAPRAPESFGPAGAARSQASAVRATLLAYHSALHLAQEHGDEACAARNALHLAHLYDEHGVPDLAYEHALVALSGHADLSHREHLDATLLIARVCRALREYSEALSHLHAAERLAEATYDHARRDAAVLLRARVRADLDRPHETLEEVQALLGKATFPATPGQAHLLLAETTFAGDADAGERRLTLAARLARDAGDEATERAAVLGLARVTLRLGRPDDALPLATQALRLAESAPPAFAKDVHLVLSRVYETLGDASAALTHFKAHHHLDEQARAAHHERAAIARDAYRSALRARATAPSDATSAPRQDAALGERANFERQLAHEFARAEHLDYPLTLVIVDLPDLPSAADERAAVLRDVAEILGDHAHDLDIVARLDETRFALLLPGADGEHARLLAERVRADVRARHASHLRVGLCDDLTLEEPEAMIEAAARLASV